MNFYDKALSEGRSDIKWFTGRIAAGYEMYNRLKNTLMESDFSPLNRSLFYEKVYTKLHLGSRGALLMTLIAWEIHIDCVKLADPYCSINMDEHHKIMAFEYNKKANDFFLVTEHMLANSTLPASKITILML